MLSGNIHALLLTSENISSEEQQGSPEPITPILVTRVVTEVVVANEITTELIVEQRQLGRVLRRSDVHKCWDHDAKTWRRALIFKPV